MVCEAGGDLLIRCPLRVRVRGKRGRRHLLSRRSSFGETGSVMCSSGPGAISKQRLHAAYSRPLMTHIREASQLASVTHARHLSTRRLAEWVGIRRVAAHFRNL